MTPEEIKKIAEEYSASVDWGDYEDKQADTVSAEMPYHDALCFLEWLSERYYLAPKDKANAYYNGDTFGELDFIELISTRRVLKSLFGPEIGKEEEE